MLHQAPPGQELPTWALTVQAEICLAATGMWAFAGTQLPVFWALDDLIIRMRQRPARWSEIAELIPNHVPTFLRDSYEDFHGANLSLVGSHAPARRRRSTAEPDVGLPAPAVVLQLCSAALTTLKMTSPVNPLKIMTGGTGYVKYPGGRKLHQQIIASKWEDLIAELPLPRQVSPERQTRPASA